MNLILSLLIAVTLASVTHGKDCYQCLYYFEQDKGYDFLKSMETGKYDAMPQKVDTRAYCYSSDTFNKTADPTEKCEANSICGVVSGKIVGGDEDGRDFVQRGCIKRDLCPKNAKDMAKPVEKELEFTIGEEGAEQKKFKVETKTLCCPSDKCNSATGKIVSVYAMLIAFIFAFYFSD